MWYYKNNQQTIGPVSFEEIVHQINAGVIASTSIVQAEGEKACRAGQHPNLKMYFTGQSTTHQVTTSWYYSHNGHKVGPVPYEEVINQINAKVILPETAVCIVGEKPCRAGQHPKLTPFFNSLQAQQPTIVQAQPLQQQQPTIVQAQPLQQQQPAFFNPNTNQQSGSASQVFAASASGSFPSFESSSGTASSSSSKPKRKHLKKKSAQNNTVYMIAAGVIGVVIIGIICSVLFTRGGKRTFTAITGTSPKTIVFGENDTRENLLKQAQQGDAEAQFKYAIRCKEEKDGAKWMKKSAENGYARAQFYLGVAYTDGDMKGIEANSDKSKEWITKSANQGFPMAIVYQYYKGIGVEPDKDKALSELRSGAEAGFVDAQFYLGMCYLGDNPNAMFHFKELDKSKDSARYWIEKSADNGFLFAQRMMILLCKSEDKNEESVKWLKKVAKQADDSAQFQLGYAYYRGNGVEENLAEAKKWFERSAKQGNESAQEMLDIINNKNKDDDEESTSTPKSSLRTKRAKSAPSYE